MILYDSFDQFRKVHVISKYKTMKRIITLLCVLLLICSCSNSTKTTVDLTVGNIGDTVSIIDESVGNDNWYIVTDTVCYNDTIVNQLVQ